MTFGGHSCGPIGHCGVFCVDVTFCSGMPEVPIVQGAGAESWYDIAHHSMQNH